MTTANIETSIYRALAPRPDEGLVPRVSKREAQQVVDAAAQGAGPDSHLESVYVATFVLGPDHPELLEILEGEEVERPDFGQPGRDYVIEDEAIPVFDRYFRRHAVPVAGARGPIVAEMIQQLLNLGKGRTSIPDEPSFRLELEDPRGDRYIGRLNANTRTFFIEAEGAAQAGRSRYYGPFRLDGHPDFSKR